MDAKDNKFRLNAKKLSLTWPRCPINKEDALRDIKLLLPHWDTIIVARELHQDGGEHLHAAVLLRQACDIKSASKLDLFARSVRYHGNYQKAIAFDSWIEYCKKGGDWIGEGTYTTKEERKKLARASKNEILLAKTVRQAVKDGDITILQADTLRKCKETYDADSVPSNARNINRHCIWVYGDPGCGKSAWVRQEYGSSLYYKTPDKWWDFYNGETNVLLEDLDFSKAKDLVQLLKLWSDIYNFAAECKGGRKNLKYDGFFVTSNFLPCHLWSDPMLRKAVERRFTFGTTEIVPGDEFKVIFKKIDI